MSRILLVEDDPAIAELVELALKDGGHRVERAGSLAAARRLLAGAPPEAVLLDLNLPDGSGLELCRELRAKSRVPLLILTARRGEADRVAGLELGADDYIVKPFSPREVLARVEAVLRRQRWEHESSAEEVLRAGDVEVDLGRREVRIGGEPISFTRTEFRIVEEFVRRPGRVFSREQLIERVWEGSFIDGRVVDSVISRVRRKLGPLPDGRARIRTVHGVGYGLEETE